MSTDPRDITDNEVETFWKAPKSGVYKVKVTPQGAGECFESDYEVKQGDLLYFNVQQID